MIRRLFNLVQLFFAVTVVLRLSTGARRKAPVETREDLKQLDVSVIIPARNEALRLPACLDAINGDIAHEILVVDDNSNDATDEVATAHGAKVLSAPSLPSGWVGKPWALQHGLEHATGEWVVFLDADTRPRPGFLTAVIERASASTAHVVSLSASFETNSEAQQALHASFLAGLIYRFGPVGALRQPKTHRVLVNGQCIVARREWLQAQGGFAATAANMTDDVAFAQAVAARGGSIEFLDGSDVLDVNMYATARETWDEWSRSLPMSDVLPLRMRAFDATTLWFTQVVPVVRALRLRPTALDVVLLAMRFALIAPMRRAFRTPSLAMWLSPLLDPLAVAKLTAALIQPARSWRGRDYGTSQNAGR